VTNQLTSNELHPIEIAGVAVIPEEQLTIPARERVSI